MVDKLGQPLLDLLLTDGVVIRQLLPSVQHRLEHTAHTSHSYYTQLFNDQSIASALLLVYYEPTLNFKQLCRRLLYLNGRLVGSQLGLQSLVFLPQILYSCQITSVVLRTHEQLLFSAWRGDCGEYVVKLYHDSVSLLLDVSRGETALLDPRFLIVQVPEELVQAVGLVQFGPAACSHALDLSEAAVDGVTFVLHLRGVEGVAGHQAVGLAVQILQTILRERRGGSEEPLRVSLLTVVLL